jgi:predicted ArsR family transcriptional regulator
MTAKKNADGVTRQAVLEYLTREADMDGLVTVAEQEIGDALGISQASVSWHVQSLAGDGVLAIVGRAEKSTRGCPVNAIQLSEEVYA